jgi:hypothetical protein
MWNPVYVWQQIGTWDPDVDYEVSMFVGKIFSDSALQVEFWAGGNPDLLPLVSGQSYGFGSINTVGATLIGEATFTPTVMVGEYEFMTVILNTGTGFTPGDPLWLRIQSISGSYTYLDNAMVSNLIDPSLASKPKPPNGATEVLRNVVLSWKPGEYPGTHNIYFGTDFNDVNDSIADVLLSEGQDANTFDPGLLELGQIYYWRVDEVNDSADSTLYRGNIWSFTTEPFAYKIPSASITASASSQENDTSGPENTINESGLDPNNMDLHLTSSETMWLTDDANAAEPAWIQYDFNKLYKLHQMLVWNYNGQFVLSGFGVKDANIEYSEDGQTWTQLSSTTQFERAPGTVGYEYNTIVDFNGLAVKSVKINALTKWGGDIYPQSGLSEVRFTYIPVRARDPYPSDMNDVPVDVTLSWRAGREAQQHIVSLSTDQQAVSDGSAVVDTIGEASYSPLLLDIANVYYWRIDEVNNAETPTTWNGDTWSFRTQEYLIVEDFEFYTDEEPDRIWDFWADGWDDNNNGSTIGYPAPDFDAGEHFVETNNVYGGEQSGPIIYDNSSATYSEVSINVADLPIGTNWSAGSPETLVLWFCGDPGNTPAQMYVKINNQSPEYYPGDIDAVIQPLWRQWNIDITGYNLSAITSLAIGFERADTPGGESKVLVDEIRLYREVPPVPSEEMLIEAESGTVNAPMMIYDDPSASGGQYIMKDPDTPESTGGPPSDGLVTYSFEVDGGTYTIAGLVITDGSDDSFWVRIPGAEMNVEGDPSNPGWIEWNGMTQENVWGWEDVFSSNNDDVTVEFTLSAGTHTLEIMYREDESRLDLLVITSID